MTSHTIQISTTDATIAAEVSGHGERTILLVHGFPHTRALWSALTPRLLTSHRVIAVDLRGLGDSSRATSGYDGMSLADDLEATLDACDVDAADIMAIDAGVPAAFLLALTRPHRVHKLVLMESTLGTLPGAEDFFANGAPWWFGFHQVPGLAENALLGNEETYLDFFYRAGTHSGAGIDSVVRQQFIDRYRGRESLRCGFEYYRQLPVTNRQLHAQTQTLRLTMPTLAIGSAPVGPALHQQLVGITDDLRGEIINACGHIIPLDAPDKLINLVQRFL